MTRDARIRLAASEDAEGIARCHVGGWKVHYRGILPDALLDAIDYEERLARHRRRLTPGAKPRPGEVWLDATDWVLEEGGAIRGWASAGPARDEDVVAGTYELYAIYLDPDQVGKGYGRALAQHAIGHAAAQGHREMVMWVLSGNERARRFYEAAGFEVDGRVPAEPFKDTGQTQLRMRRPLP